ncbi:MAG: hypothetical protein WCC38_17000 [Pseudonocardiaceae bacterium]
MSFAGVTSFILALNDMVVCPTCTRPACVEDRFHLDSTDGLVEHLRTSCIGGHSAVQLADRITHVSLPAPHQPSRSAP